jgi:hypothetical protein
MFDLLPKITKLIKYYGDKRRNYDAVPLDWDINNYDVYNKNELIEMIYLWIYIFS